MKTQKISFPMKNSDFLKVLSNAFVAFLASGTSRSTKKLKPLHGAIALDLSQKLGNDYEIVSQGFGEGKEGKLLGRYFEKMVDIIISKNSVPVAGLAVKFIMQNYSQNSNNYFENMLGETANIRCAKIPYFQIFIIFDELPYYENGGKITKWETFSQHNAEKYLKLSQDNVDAFFHTPNKTLIYIIHIPENKDLRSRKEYMNFYKKLNCKIESANILLGNFGNAVIINDYETFIKKVFHTIEAQ